MKKAIIGTVLGSMLLLGSAACDVDSTTVHHVHHYPKSKTTTKPGTIVHHHYHYYPAPKATKKTATKAPVYKVTKAPLKPKKRY